MHTYITHTDTERERELTCREKIHNLNLAFPHAKTSPCLRESKTEVIKSSTHAAPSPKDARASLHIKERLTATLEPPEPLLAPGGTF